MHISPDRITRHAAPSRRARMEATQKVVPRIDQPYRTSFSAVTTPHRVHKVWSTSTPKSLPLPAKPRDLSPVKSRPARSDETCRNLNKEFSPSAAPIPPVNQDAIKSKMATSTSFTSANPAPKHTIEKEYVINLSLEDFMRHKNAAASQNDAKTPNTSVLSKENSSVTPDKVSGAEQSGDKRKSSRNVTSNIGAFFMSLSPSSTKESQRNESSSHKSGRKKGFLSRIFARKKRESGENASFEKNNSDILDGASQNGVCNVTQSLSSPENLNISYISSQESVSPCSVQNEVASDSSNASCSHGSHANASKNNYPCKEPFRAASAHMVARDSPHSAGCNGAASSPSLLQNGGDDVTTSRANGLPLSSSSLASPPPSYMRVLYSLSGYKPYTSPSAAVSTSPRAAAETVTPAESQKKQHQRQSAESAFQSDQNISSAATPKSDSLVRRVSPAAKPLLPSNDSTDSVTEKDGKYFLRVMEDVEAKLKASCNVAEKHLEEKMPEEVQGRIRATKGKAQLLMTKKFKQFRGLCDKNLTQSSDEPFQTTSQDLAGFWDLVQIQVDQVTSGFEEIEAMRTRGWAVSPLNSAQATPKAARAVSKARGGTKTGSASSTPRTARAHEIAKQREDARRRLILAKKKGRERKRTASEDVEIFVP